MSAVTIQEPPPFVEAVAPRARHPLVAFVARRLLAGVLTLLVISLLIFLATHALPGSVVDVVLGKSATPQQVAALNERLHLDDPLLSQYATWLGEAIHGDLGDSSAQIAQGATSAPISGQVGTALTNSLILAALAAVLVLPLAIMAGTFAGVRAGRAGDYTVSYGALVLGSLPEFVLGTFLIMVFFSQLDLFPPVSLVAAGQSPLDHPDTLVLPVLTLLGVSLAFCARQVRAGVVEALRHDCVPMARLNGIPERRVLWRYALCNALAPSVQSFAQTFQYLLGGVIVVEALFAYPGIGSLLVNAVQTRDITMVQSIALVLAAIYILINTVSDLVVVLLVPKLRTGAR